MKQRIMFLLVSLIVMLSSCAKDPNPDPGTRFSVLGDSFSALEGYVDPDSNDVFWAYPNIGVTEPEQMWWHQVALETGWVLEKNNSFSGALICNYNAENYYGPHSFIRRLDNLGNPDVVFVFGGTNDINRKVSLGEYVYTDWSEEQLCDFRPAMAFLLSELKRQYPKAVIYLLVDMELCIGDQTIDNETRQAFIGSMHRIADHYRVDCIELFGIHKDWWHPNAQGQEDIARQVVEALLADFNV